MHWGSFFQRPGPNGENLHRGAVQGDRLNPYFQYPLPLKELEDPL